MSVGLITETMNALAKQVAELSKRELTAEELQNEVSRAKAIASCSEQIIRASSLVLQAEHMRLEYSQDQDVIPKVLRDE